jgi:hypothetical protein
MLMALAGHHDINVDRAVTQTAGNDIDAALAPPRRRRFL